MKFFVLIIGIAAIYIFATREEKKSPPPTPAAPVAATPAPAKQSAAVPGTLRAPIDRTRRVLEDVKMRNGNGEF